MTQRVKAASWLTDTDPAGLLYGAIVSAAVLATVSAHAEGSTFVGVATALVLGVYWLSHVYIDTLSSQLEGDPALPAAVRTRAPRASVLKGGVPAIRVYVVATCRRGNRRAAAPRCTSRSSCWPRSATWALTRPG